MANENENIQPEAGENHDAPKHTSWLGNIIDKVQDLDTDFPLSGGEEDPRPPRHHSESTPAAANEGTGSTEQPEHHESFLHHLAEEIKHKINNLDTDFPLSGGEE